MSADGNGMWAEPGVTRQRYGGVMSNSLDLIGLKAAAAEFAESLRDTPIPELFGTTDGKALGTWIEANFNEFLAERHAYSPGNAARGIDFPELEVDLKATFINQPSHRARSATRRRRSSGWATTCSCSCTKRTTHTRPSLR